jgi:hypothetical protein
VEAETLIEFFALPRIEGKMAWVDAHAGAVAAQLQGFVRELQLIAHTEREGSPEEAAKTPQQFINVLIELHGYAKESLGQWASFYQ